MVIQVNRYAQSGQALVAVILVMVIALTVALSIATRNVTNLQLTTEEQNSQRALSAAEAGIERSLKSDSTGVIISTPQSIGSAKIERVEVKDTVGSTLLLHEGKSIGRNNPVDIWLSTYSNTDPSAMYSNPYVGNLLIYWEGPSSCTSNAAIDIMAIVNPGGGGYDDAFVRHYPVDPCSTRRLTNNFCPNSGSSNCELESGANDPNFSFTTPSTTIGNVPFGNLLTLRFDAANPAMLVRVTSLYAGTKIAIEGRNAAGQAQSLPSQGSTIESIGSSGNTQRKITVNKEHPKLPLELFYTIFSP